MDAKKIRAVCKPVRIVMGAALIAYGVQEINGFT